jgi:ribulose kinase
VSPTIALNERLKEMASAAGTSVAVLARDVHVTPDALGNRSPLADPLMRAAVVGLGLSATLDDLAFLYLAAVQALAYQTRHIIEAMEEAGHPPITSVIACGGLSKNVLYVSTHADVLGRTIYLPVQDEAVLLGAAILGTVAAGAHPSIAVAMERMSAVGTTVRPGGGEGGGDVELHERKYRVFRKMTEDQRAYRNIMAGG